MRSEEISKFRTYLPQILASTVKNLLVIDLGLAVAFPTIIIPALRNIIKTDSNETLHFTDVQASWFGSILYIFQPIGSLLSGWITDPLGRKKAMMIVNIPFICAWILLHFANSIFTIYMGAILLGLGVGFMEAPIITYIGEICQPSIRGILICSVGVSSNLGLFFVFYLGTATTWRTAALICLGLPILTIIAICFIPETPMWLLSKNRNADALKSLQWLRGWVPSSVVENEFNELQVYNENSKKCLDCEKTNNLECEHRNLNFGQKCKDLSKKNSLKAFLIVLGPLVIGQFSGIISMRPFMVQIVKAYNIPMDPSNVTLQIGIAGFLGNVFCMLTVHFIGKRLLCISGYIALLICSLSLGTYAQFNFPPNYNSFDLNENTELPSSIFPVIVFLLYSFFTNYGALSIPWFLLSEVFPFKVRGLAGGICAAGGYFFAFISTKLYLNLDTGFSLNGVMWFYSAVNLIGLIFVYFLVPETENRSLEDIEKHFSDDNKNIWNINIVKHKNNKDSVTDKDNATIHSETKKDAIGGQLNTTFVE